ncbi:MAG: hypothetical protein WAW09_05005, partial [Smithella sp.]
QPMQDVLTPMKNAGKLYKLILKLEKGQTNTAYVNLFNGLHILGHGKAGDTSKPVGAIAEPDTIGDYLCRPKGKGAC